MIKKILTSRDFWLEMLAVLSVIFVFTLFFVSIISYLDRPDIHMSHSTGECVRMITHDGSSVVFTECPDPLPKKYNIVWVQ